MAESEYPFERRVLCRGFVRVLDAMFPVYVAREWSRI